MSLILGMMLDAVFGEPKSIWDRVPHPAVLMGRAVGWCDASFNTGEARRLKGALVMAVLVGLAVLFGWAVSCLGWVAEALVVAVMLAQKSLVEHVRAVADGLRMSVSEGRRAVARIVGRDVAEMDESAVARAAIESAAENFSDGVAAPVFWYLVAGLPGLVVYKITNTADSMIGYRTERHEAFGWAAARLDDVLNLVPARLSAVVFMLVSGRFKPWRAVWRDAGTHRSVNAGWPEAAMAQALGVALAGPRSYEGTMQDFAWVNGAGNRAAGPRDIDQACRLLWLSWMCWVAIVFVLSIGVWIF